jgi:hypothetical protein
MTKSQQFFEDMMTYNKELFDAFKDLHDKYAETPEKYKDEFNEKGQEILQVIRRYENMLASKQEAGAYGKFSSKLAEKFWEPIRAHFPKIDSVGVL